jgi:hypothetical protein
MRGRVLGLIGALSLGTACAAPSATPVPPTLTITPAATPTVTAATTGVVSPAPTSPSATGSPTPTLAGANKLCSTTPGQECPVEAGRYEVPEFEPPIAFDLADTWINNSVEPHSISFISPPGPDTSDEFFEIASDITTMYGDRGEPITIDDTPEAFIEWLQGRETMMVEQPLDVTVGGLPATQIDAVMVEGGMLYSYADTPATYLMAPGQRIRFVTLMVGTTRVQIAAEAPDDRFSEFWTRVEPIIASITFLEAGPSASASPPTSP